MRALAEVQQSQVQAKLDVGRSDDAAEHEADRIADVVLRRLATPASTRRRVARGAQRQVLPPAAGIQRRATMVARRGATIGPKGGVLPSQTERAIDTARGGGSALATGTRTRFEAAMGADLSGVRIHTDGHADRLSRSMQATAFTTGSDVFFSSGAFDPSSRAGQHLLAHELAHTVQQGAAPVMRRVADPLTYTRADGSGQRKVRRVYADHKTMTVAQIREEKAGDPTKGARLARVKAGQVIRVDPDAQHTSNPEYVKAKENDKAKEGWVRKSRVYNPSFMLGSSLFGVTQAPTVDQDEEAVGLDESAGILGLSGVTGDTAGAVKSQFGSTDTGDRSFGGKLKGDGGQLSNKDVAGHMEKMEVAGASAGIVTSFLSIAQAVKAFRAGEMKGTDKAQLGMDLASGVTGVGTGIAGTIKEASELTGEGGKSLGKSAEAAGFMGSVGEAITAVKSGFAMIKEIYETWKENKEGKADEGTNAKHAISIVRSALETAAGVVKVIKSILDTLSMGVGALAQAVPGLSIVISAANIAVRVYDMIRANIGRAATRVVKQVIKAKHKIAKGTTWNTAELRKDPAWVKKMERRKELQDKRLNGPLEEKEQLELDALDEEAADLDEYELAKELQSVGSKRMVRGGFKIGIELTKIASEIATLSGVGAVAGQPLKFFAAGADIGSSVWRRIKFYARDKAAESRGRGEQTFWNTKVVTGMSTAEKKTMREGKVKVFLESVERVDRLPADEPPSTKKTEAMGRIIAYIKGFGVTEGEIRNTKPEELGKLLYEAIGKRE